MLSEKDKMLAGEPYKAFDKVLLEERQNAKSLLFDYNQLHPLKVTERDAILQKLLGKIGHSFFIEPPFRCDYGYNIVIGNNFYANYNLTVLDCAKVSIGNNVFIGPNVDLLAAGHPIHHEPRNEEWEYGLPITIEDNVWIGGKVVINAGVSIGESTVIGSGSVVTKDIPKNVIAAGNPCKVLRKITENDKAYIYKQKRLK